MDQRQTQATAALYRAYHLKAMKTLIARNFRRSAESLARIADETGVHIRLCLEPEPWTMLETTQDAVDFFQAYLPLAYPHVREHLGLCYSAKHYVRQGHKRTPKSSQIHRRLAQLCLCHYGLNH